MKTGRLIRAGSLVAIGLLATTLVSAPAVASDSEAAPLPTTLQSPDTMAKIIVSSQAALDAAVVQKAAAPLPAARRPVRRTSARSTYRRQTVRRAAIRRATARQTAARRSTSRSGELAEAQRILRGLVRKHPIASGATVAIRATPNNYQAVCYYKSGRIIISPSHRASLTRILNHEIWHVIDWRDNHRIDWGEHVPR